VNTWEAGTKVGPYVLISEIGTGAMGDVWKARDTRLDRIVAIKRLRVPGETIEREARTIAGLNHPHICTLHDIGSDYLVMEYVDGAPVAGPMEPAEAVRIALQIVSALEAAHGKGITHRDLKPANILLSGGRAKLLDFGIARTRVGIGPDSTMTAEGSVSGTPAYMAPEQAQGRATDARSDIFSFGAVLYEMLSGRRAFDAPSSIETLTEVLRDDPPPLDAPPALTDVVKRCLEKSPTRRYQTLAELKTALEQLGDAREQGASIAVLPFTNLGSDPEQEYFSDGLADEIINLLAQIPGLKVIARTSSFAFKGRALDVRQIAATLGVRSVLEGSVRKAGRRIRVTAQLVSARDATHLWSERFDRDLADVFEVQDEIATAIAAALKTTLSDEARAREHTPSIPAYEAFLKARHHQYRLTAESVALTRMYFEKAIAQDQQFADAHARLSAHYLNLAMIGMVPIGQAATIIRAEAQRAIDLDPSLTEAHAILGWLAAVYDYDWREAARRFAEARRREPVPVSVRGLYATFRVLHGEDPGDAADELKPALPEDPLSVMLHHELGICLLAAGRHAEARERFQEAVTLEPTFGIARALMAASYWAEGRFTEAFGDAKHTQALLPDDPVCLGMIAGMLDELGKAGSAPLLERLGDGSRYGTSMGLAVYHLVRHDLERAADLILKAAAERYPSTLLFMRLPFAQRLRASAHWQRIARMLNLDVASAGGLSLDV
jgi:serine/threonine-protein kinase